MLNTNKRKLAELTLIFGVPILMDAQENSRLAGLQRKLQKLVMPDLLALPGIGNEEILFVDSKMEAWFKQVGWWKNPTKVSTLISFCMDMLEESPYKYNPKIMDTLDDIAVHLDKNQEFIRHTMQERDALLDSWKAIYM